MNVAYDVLVESLLTESVGPLSSVSGRKIGKVGSPAGIGAWTSAIQEASDHSLASAEYLNAGLAYNDWGLVTPFRTVIGRAFDIPARSRILEVSALAGTLTRYLGETGANVIALEHASELYQLARQRCRDLQNVSVMRSALEELNTDRLFDFIFCVDPFLSTDTRIDPAAFLFNRCRSLLKSTGTLVLSIANPITAPGPFAIQDLHAHVRGSRLPLEPVQEMLQASGFRCFDIYLAFPNPVAPRMLLHLDECRRRGTRWASKLCEAYQGTAHAAAEIETWWAAACEQKLEATMAPGWIIAAHAHRVHHVMWNGWNVRRFHLEQQGVDQQDEVPGQEGSSVPLPCADNSAVLRGERASKPLISTLKEVRGALEIAHERLQDLSKREQDMASSFARTEEGLRSELRKAWDEAFAKERDAERLQKRCERLEAHVASLSGEARTIFTEATEISDRNSLLEQENIKLLRELNLRESEIEYLKLSFIGRLIRRLRKRSK